MAYLSLVAMNEEWIVGFVKHDFENSGDDVDWNHNFWIFMCRNLDSDVVNAILVDKVIEFGIFVILVDQGAVVCQLLRRDYSMLRKNLLTEWFGDPETSNAPDSLRRESCCGTTLVPLLRNS